LKADNVEAKFNALPGVQRGVIAQRRANMSDFDRFKVKLAQQKRALAVRLQIAKLKNAGKPAKAKVTREQFVAALKQRKAAKKAARAAVPKVAENQKKRAAQKAAKKAAKASAKK
jgi:hypothetical protein